MKKKENYISKENKQKTSRNKIKEIVKFLKKSKNP